MPTHLPARVLIIAGSDSSGGAGIQADIKTATALGAYAMTAVTAVTVQNTHGVSAFHAIPPEIVAGQIEAVLSDIGTDAIKTGMLVSAEIVEAVAGALYSRTGPPPLASRAPPPHAGEENKRSGASVSSPIYGGGAVVDGGGGAVSIPLIVDTVMIAKGGAALLDDAGIEALRTLLFPRAALLTPNAPEAARLTGMAIQTPEDSVRAAQSLLQTGARAVLIKGGHLAGNEVVDVLADAQGVQMFRGQRIGNASTHGTGCTLASAIATGLGQGLSLKDAVIRARSFVQEAIRTGLPLGHGTGPVNHLHVIRPFEP